MSVVWKLNGSSFASLGIARLRRELRSLAPDLVTFVADGVALDAAEPTGLASGDTVTITCEINDGSPVQWFKGRITSPPREGSARGERMLFEVTGPWWFLDNLVYQQIFPLNATANPTVVSPSTARRAVAVIGQNYLGALQTNVAELTDVLDYCIGAGAGFTRGTLPTGFLMPLVSLMAPTCAEAVRACLRWMPDCATRFDYTSETPVFSAVRRADADAQTIAIVPNGVKRLAPVRVAATTNINLAAAGNVIDGVTLVDGDRLLLLGQTYPEQNGIYVWIYGGDYSPISRADDADSAGELNLAAVRVNAGIHAGETWLQIETIVTLDTDPITWLRSSAINALEIKPRPDLKIDHAVIQNISIDGSYFYVVARDVDPSGSTGLEFGSVVVPIDNNLVALPSGVAANWRSSLSTLQWQGRVIFEESECLKTVRPGDVINIANGMTAWKTMRAQVMTVKEDVDAGTTEWVFGPPEHLAVQDLVNILKAARTQMLPGPTMYIGKPLGEAPDVVSEAGSSASDAADSAWDAANSASDAADSARAAAASASAAAGSASAAAGSVSDAAGAAGDASASAGAAASSASDASTYASNASASASDAAGSEADAAGSASAASDSADAASASASDASDSADASAGSAEAAANSADDAAGSASDASDDAAAASGSAADASGSASDAADSAGEANTAANDAADSQSAASDSADAAAASASSADDSAFSAEGSASDAAASADDASGSADNAAVSEGVANDSADAADGFASDASDSADAAAGSASAATGSAEDAANSADDAAGSALAAAGSAADAASSASDAANSADDSAGSALDAAGSAEDAAASADAAAAWSTALESRVAALESWQSSISETPLDYCGGSSTFLTV